jgi:hypothetical protein
MTRAHKSLPQVMAALEQRALDGDTTAIKILVDAAKHLSALAVPVSSPITGLRLSCPRECADSLEVVTRAAAEGRIGLKEARELTDMISRVDDARAAQALDQIRSDVDEVKRQVQAGAGRVIDGAVEEIRPQWGRQSLRRQ